MDLRKGDRVRAVHFPLDTGLRIWPNQGDDSGRVRVVQVTGPDEFAVRFEGSQQDAAAQFPHATWSINDNESVPPGTLGTVDPTGAAPDRARPPRQRGLKWTCRSCSPSGRRRRCARP
jgi:hypothetical protein